MNKNFFLCLFIFIFLSLIASLNPVRAGEVLTVTIKKAVEQGWLKLYIGYGEAELSDYCTIRKPSEAEISDLVTYCEANETSWTFEGPTSCEYHIRGIMADLCLNHRDAVSYLKLTPASILKYTPTGTPTSFITPILTAVPAPKEELSSTVAGVNSKNLLREILLSTLISFVAITAYHFVIQRRK